MNDQPLDKSRALLLLTMGEGEMRIPDANRWQQPLVMIGEVAGAKWKQYESFRPQQDGNMLKLPISAIRSLSMMILCEAADQAGAVRTMEAWVNRPWSLVS